MDRLNDGDIAELAARCDGRLSQDVDLSTVSWWRIGGLADIVLRPSSTEQVASLCHWFAAREIRPVVIGQMTNLLFDDAGLRAPCIQISRNMSKVAIFDNTAWVQAGAWVPGLARKLMQAGLGGAEHICGIPGTLGGLICMNGGSQRKGIAANVCEVRSVNGSGHTISRNVDECEFGYRKSVFQANDEIITSARMQFQPRHRSEIHSEMLKILTDRSNKFPRKQPNCGSVFKSNPTMYADVGPPGAVIERLGFKGKRIGGAMVSRQHANFIVNTGNARARDVLALIAEIDEAARSATGYQLDAEVGFVNTDGRITPANTVHLEM